ncbi:MAG: hypothetical protein AAF829_02280 [Pseudomonadota bacterium]
MKRLFRTFRQSLMALFLGPFLAAGCQNTGNIEPSDFDGISKRSDGSIIEWRLENARPEASNKILLIAQGSGCAPARSSANVDLLANIATGFATLTIEKYGVSVDDAPANSSEDCTETYFMNHTVSQRVADARTVLADLAEDGLWNGALYLFGGSEGGAVVSILSQAETETDAVAVFSTGTGLTMAEFFPMVVPPPVAARMQDIFDAVRANPDAEGIAGGNSYRWWADILDRRLSDDLLQSTAPILLVHGVNDRSAPVASARSTRDAFATAAQSSRLTYWELEDRDHAMIDQNGQSHMADVLRDVVEWLEQRTSLHD